MKQSNVNEHTNRFTTVLFIIYLIVLGWVLLLKLGVHFSYMEERRTNLIPFGDFFILTTENIWNVLIFVPLGIYTEILFEKWGMGKKLCFAFLLSLLIEGLQYTLRIGAFDSTDIITNSLGAVIGFIVFKALASVFRSRAKAQKLMNPMAALGTAVMILLLCF